MHARRGAEQSINGRPEPVLLRTAQDTNLVLVQQEVMIRRGNVDVPLLKLCSIGRMGDGEIADIVEEPGQNTLLVSRDMLHHKDCRADVCWQRAQYGTQRFQAASGSTNNDDVVSGHLRIPTSPSCTCNR